MLRSKESSLKNSLPKMPIDYNLTIAALPLDIVPGDVAVNLESVEGAFASLPEGTDVVVLPELFTTGFIADADVMSRLAEPLSGDTLQRIRTLAARYNVAIAGSYLARTASKVFNRAFFIEPSGEDAYYDKPHLFSISAEASILSAGNPLPPVIRFRGWNISMVICYDIRFPVWCRNVDQRYDILLVPANWPQARGYAWKHLLIARAIENQAAVVGANRSGSDEFGSYDGETYIYDQQGQPVATQHGQWVTATISRDALRQYRLRFPVQADADSFSLQ